MVIVVCGVSGSGKSTVGELLAAALAVPFFDADDFHSTANRQKMADGEPLDDADRQPWLDNLAANIATWQQGHGAVLACSALKENYRQALGAKSDTALQWIYLHATRQQLVERLTQRQGHFFSPELLDSQLAAMEVPDYGWQLNTRAGPAELVGTILTKLDKV